MKNKITIIAIILAIIGYIVVLSRGKQIAGIGKFYNQNPLNAQLGIAVDSRGYIYIGEKESSSIQVYNSSGEFKFGFTFPSLREADIIVFSIYDDDIYIISRRTGNLLVFNNNGELIKSEKYSGTSSYEELKTKYNMLSSDTFSTTSKIYKISIFNIVSIQEKASGKIEKIHLNAPIWPLPVRLFMFMAYGGAITAIILNIKVLIKWCRPRGFTLWDHGDGDHGDHKDGSSG